jgi:hypothetical protein
MSDTYVSEARAIDARMSRVGTSDARPMSTA